MNKKIAKDLLVIARNLTAMTLEEYEKLEQWRLSEFEKLEKEFGDSKVICLTGTMYPVRIEFKRNQFDIDEFQNFVQRKEKEISEMKKALQHAKSIRNKAEKISQKDKI